MPNLVQIPNPKQTRGSSEPVVDRCGAKLSGTNPPRYCTRRPVKDRNRCRIHGGAVPRGKAHPHYKDGKRSRYEQHLPQDIQDLYERALKDEQLLSMRSNLARQEAMIRAAGLEWADGQPVPWKEMAEAVNNLMKTANDDTSSKEDLDHAVQTVVDLAERGASADKVERRLKAEMRELMQEQTKTAKVEHDRLIDLQALLPVDVVIGFVTTFYRAVLDSIPDEVACECGKSVATRKYKSAAAQKALSMLPRPQGVAEEVRIAGAVDANI